MTTKRTRLRPVYLTDTERDLVVQGIDVLSQQLDPKAEQHLTQTSVTKFARSHTNKRLLDVRALFVDKTPTEGQA